MDLESRYQFAINIAAKLSEFQLSFNAREINIERKDDRSPVTEADKRSEQMFREAVKEAFPDDCVFGEEHEGSESSEIRWVIDPIDGTRKFMRGLPFWGICIAFECGKSIEIGVIAVPGVNMIWSAMKNKGAWCNGKKIQVDNTIKNLPESFITMPSRSFFVSERLEHIFDPMQNIIEHDPGFLDAYSYAMVGDGRINAVVSCADKWWDIAAAVCIIEEAGGVFTDAKGNKPCTGGLNIASSASLHEPIMRFIEERQAYL